MITRQVAVMTGISLNSLDCCINSCLAFTGPYEKENRCPICKEHRYGDNMKARKTFDYIPLIHRLRLQYADPDRASLLKEYRRKLEADPWAEGVRDYWDGLLYQEQKGEGLFEDEHDIGLAFSTDGLSLFTVGNFSVWPLVLVNLNLRPEVRVKKENILLYGIIPGPSSPKDMQSFLHPLINELLLLEAGVPDVDDGSTPDSPKFTLHAYLCFCSGDLPAIAKVMGISGHNSYDYCRFCTARGIYMSHVYCPLKTPHGWQEPIELDPNNLPLRTDHEYRRAAATLTLQFNPVNSETIYGIRHVSQLLRLRSINFPRSFPVDVMHLIFENVIQTLHKIWSSKFFSDDSGENEIVISEAVWKRLGGDMDSSRKLIPASYGRAPRSIHKYSGSWKAEEWCSFLLYYSPVLLLNALPMDLYKHYMKLVLAIEIAIHYEISHRDIEKVKRLLSQFVTDYERLYYRYERKRLCLCLPTTHLLLHLGESLEHCGPAWVYWQYYCERVCGMLKPKCKNRSSANRNVTIRILQEEQLNHLRFASNFTESPRRTLIPEHSDTIGGQEYGFLVPRRFAQLTDEDFEILAEFYASIPEQRTSRRAIQAILGSPQFLKDVWKYARCKLVNDRDLVSSQWYESRRNVDVTRRASVIQYFRSGERLGHGRVLFFFLHAYESEKPRMLVFLQSFRVEDLSTRDRRVPEDKVLEVKGDGRKEVVCISNIIAGVGLLTSGGKVYVVPRKIEVPDDAADDEANN